LCWLAFWPDSLWAVAGAGGLGAGGVEGVGHAVILAGLPDGRVAVVLAAVVDRHADPEGEGGLALGDVAVADAVSPVGGTPKVGLSRSKASSAARSAIRWWSWIQSRWSSSKATAAS
jgi:hypothetical protein